MKSASPSKQNIHRASHLAGWHIQIQVDYGLDGILAAAEGLAQAADFDCWK
jgi:hypothetical protein